VRAKYMLGFSFALLLVAAYVARGRAGDIAKPAVDLSVYGHVSSVVWVVKDLDPVLNYWEKLGLKNLVRSKATESVSPIYKGKLAPTTVRTAFGRVGDVVIEWIQPVIGNNLYTEFLKRHGDGILGLGFAVKTDRQLEEQIQYLQSKGVEVVQRTQWRNAEGMGHGAYLDTAAKGGGIAVLLYHDPDGPAPAELKTRFMKGQLLLVECEPLGPGLDALSHAPGVLDAAVFGSSLHAVVADAQAAMPGIRAALTTRGLMVGRLEHIQPSLEDVFVALTAARESQLGRSA